jgi:hypothetical protein
MLWEHLSYLCSVICNKKTIFENNYDCLENIYPKKWVQKYVGM